MLSNKVLLTLMLATATAYGGTVTGTLLGPSGLPIKNGTLNFSLQQAGLIAGSGSVVPVTASCYTSADGSVTGMPNPLTPANTSITYSSGTMAAGIYYVAIAFYDGAGNRTLASPELQVQLTNTGSLIVSPPATFPGNAAGMTIFLGTASGAETGQGNTVGPTQVFTQNQTPVTTATTLPASNTSPCSMAFNDTIIPYSGYNVSLLSSSGNAYPGWPQAWQLNGGANGTVNISNGAPLWNGTILYPQPILAQPLNHGPQSIAGLLDMSGYKIQNTGGIGVGVVPVWGVDVAGYINSTLGYLVGGTGGSAGQCLVSNGNSFLPGSCGVAPTTYYQHIQKNGSLYAQEPFFNFSGNFNLVDNPGSTRTDIDLTQSGATAGTYNNANITIDQYGRVLNATNGTAIPVIQPLIINSGICTTGTTAWSTCSFTVTWPAAFANSNYSVTCTSGPGQGSSAALTGLFVSNQTATNFQITLQNGGSGGAGATTVSQINCLGMHP